MRSWPERYDPGGLDSLRDLRRTGRPKKVPRETMDGIIDRMIPSGCTPSAAQRRIHEESGTRLRITHVRKILCRRGLSPKRPQKVHVNRAGRQFFRTYDRFDAPPSPRA